MTSEALRGGMAREDPSRCSMVENTSMYRLTSENSERRKECSSHSELAFVDEADSCSLESRQSRVFGLRQRAVGYWTRQDSRYGMAHL